MVNGFGISSSRSNCINGISNNSGGSSKINSFSSDNISNKFLINMSNVSSSN